MDGYSRESLASASTEIRRVAAGDHVCMPFVSAEARTAAVVQFVAGGLKRNERVMVALPHELHGVVLEALSTEGWNAGALLSSQQLALMSNEDAFGATSLDWQHTLGLIRHACDDSRRLGFAGLRGAGHPPIAADTRSLLAYETGLCDLHQQEPTLTSLCMYAKAQTAPNTLRDLIAVHPQILLSDRLCNNSFFDPNAFREDRAPSDAQNLDWVIHQILRSRDPRDESDVMDPATLRMQIEHYRRAAVNLSRGIDLRDRVIAMLARQLRSPLAQLAPGADNAGDGHDTLEAVERLQHLGGRLEALAELLNSPTSLHPRTVDLGGLVSDCVARIREQAAPGVGPITVTTAGTVLGRVDVEGASSAIELSLRLALRHGCDGPVKVTAEKHGQIARVSVRYNGLDGTGAAAALSGRAGNQELYDWLGIDLFFARELVRRMNGVLSVASWPDDSVLFTIELPRNTPSSYGDVFA